MQWTGALSAVFCLVIFLQLSCHQWMVNAVPLPRCRDLNLTITADNNLRLFIDGVEVNNLQSANIPNKADTILLPALAQVVAISGKNEVIKGGFLGSSRTFVTDASWKCTDQYYDGWEDVTYDDFDWKNAYEVREHGDSPWYGIEGIREEASWIWILAEGCIPPGEIYVYCRKNLVGTCYSPPTVCPTAPPPTTTTTTQSPTPPPTTTTTTTTTQSPTPPPTTTTTTTQPPTPPPTTTTTTTTQPPTPPPTTTTTTTQPPTPQPTTTTTTTQPPTPPPTTTTTTTTQPPTPPPTTTTTTTTQPPTPPPTTTTTTTQPPTPPPTTTTTTQGPPTCSTQPPTQPGDCSGGTGPTCITSCDDLPDGDYQSCQGCRVYASCSEGYLSDGRPCPACLYWDDNVKKCEYTTTTCTECHAPLCSGTGASCIASCRKRSNGDYQSCKGWDVYATCSNGRLYDERPCAGRGL